MSVSSLSARTLVRYFVPLLVLSALAFAPLWLVTLGIRAPASVAQARTAVRIVYALAGAGVVSWLVLVGGAAPIVRALADGQAPSQLRALGRGLGGLVGAIAPGVLALAVVAIGGLALVVPGLVLVALLALTGASTAPTASDRLRDSIAIARPQLLRVAAVLVVALAVYAGAIALAQRGLIPVPKKPSPAHLAGYAKLARAVVLGAMLAAPIPAVVLAALHTDGARGTSETAEKNN